MHEDREEDNNDRVENEQQNDVFPSWDQSLEESSNFPIIDNRYNNPKNPKRMKISPRTSGYLHPNNDLVDPEYDQKDNLDDEQFRKPRFSINLVIVLMISLHDKVHYKERVQDRWRYSVKRIQVCMIEDDQIHVDETQSTHKYLP